MTEEDKIIRDIVAGGLTVLVILTFLGNLAILFSTLQFWFRMRGQRRKQGRSRFEA